MKLFNICFLAFLIQSINCYALQELPDSLFKKAEQGDVRAQESLGLCYASGDGVSENRTQAVYWFRKAAEKGYDRAQFRLGLCYDYGIGVSENRTQAVYWYRKAAEKGYDRAQYHLGLCYDNGIGVSKDYSQAVYWYRKAADQGYAKAKSKLKNINGNKKSQKKNDIATSGSFSESLEIQQEEPGYLFEYDKITNVPGLILARTKSGSPLKVVEIINNIGVVTADFAIAYFENDGYKLVLYLYGFGDMKEKVKNIDNYDFLNSDHFLPTIDITLSNGECLTTIMLVENKDIDDYNLAQITLAVDKMFSSSCDKNSNKELWQKYILKQLSTYNIIKIKANDTIFI